MGNIDFERKMKKTSPNGAVTDRQSRFQMSWGQGPASAIRSKELLFILAAIISIICQPIALLVSLWQTIGWPLNFHLIRLIWSVLVQLGRWWIG